MEGLRRAQAWATDTTNGTKLRALAAAAKQAPAGRALRPLMDELVPLDRSARSMQHPALWGAFACVGV